MSIYKNWHYEACPKYDFNLFIERLQKLGGDKTVKANMNRVRRHYKGTDIMEEWGQLN